jgi:hypothetical protein
MVLKAIEGYSGLAEARELKAHINSRVSGANIAELSANANMERGGPKHEAPAHS